MLKRSVILKQQERVLQNSFTEDLIHMVFLFFIKKETK